MKAHVVTVYQAPDGRWHWHRQAGNGRIVASSEQGFRRRRYAVRDAEREIPAEIGDNYRIVLIP